MTSDQIRSKFLEFFKKRGHAIIPSASLVTSDEKGITNSTLFNTAGMQPLVPYLLGKVHPDGTRLADVQKCVRTIDIDDVGDRTHATFFEMLGNWSLGDYFKREAINWSFEFLTSKEEGLGLNPNQLYVTVFEGDDKAPRDEEAADIWREIFIKNKIEGERIFYLPDPNNWWQAGDDGPCGPDTEMYYDIGNKFGGAGITHEQFLAADEARDVVEIWNDVFMQYEKKDGKIVGKLAKPSVDTGAGLERLAVTLQGVDNIYDTDLFVPTMEKINEHRGRTLKMPQGPTSVRAARIIADHLRTAVFMIADGVTPSNTDRGYILRRLFRRAVRYADLLGIEANKLAEIADAVINKYKNVYPEVKIQESKIKKEIETEETKFRQTLERGMKEFEKINGQQISGQDAFVLFSTYGFPFELTQELAKDKNLEIDEEGFKLEMKKHQELSRVSAEQKFKGGLASTGEMETKYHTATHLLLAALRKVLGGEIVQKGSNITAERLRFDFNWPEKLTSEQLKLVEDLVNQKIAEKISVEMMELPKEEAKKIVTTLSFDLSKYGDLVKVYQIGDFSTEFCGGPHVANTSELGNFKIKKEEAVAAGVRRIKATLE